MTVSVFRKMFIQLGIRYFVLYFNGFILWGHCDEVL